MLVSRYPTHETLHSQFMLALYRANRRGEALAACQRLRGVLARELGLEPSVGLRRLQHSILVSAPELNDFAKMDSLATGVELPVAVG